ncbi:MAG: MFS transporter [Armatimonadota bacterium]|nr:MFS transporter [Armatimonadota bacterium]
MVPWATQLRQFVSRYKLLLVLGSAALLAELAYAILNLSALPMYLKFSLHQEAALGVIISTFLLTEALSRPAFGALGDRIGRKPLLVAGPAVTAITSYVTVKLHGPFTIPGLVLLRAIDGLGSGALWPTAFATIGDVVDEKHRGAALSVLNVTYMGGLALGFLLGGAANEIQGTLTASFHLVSILLGMAVVILLLFFRVPKTCIHPSQEPQVVGVTPELEASQNPGEFRLSVLFRSFREVPEMIVLACVTFLGMGMLTPIVKLYGVEHLGLSETGFGLLVAPIAAAMGIAAVPLGHLGDRYGKCLALCWGLFACACAMWAVALFRSVAIAVVCGIVIGLGFTIAFPAWNSLVMSATSTDRRGEVLGAVGMAQGLSAIIGASAGAFIYASDALSFPRLGVVNYNVPFWLSAVLLTCATIVAFTWVRNRHVFRDPPPGITSAQQKVAVAACAAALLSVGLWAATSYSKPIPPDRVVWCWVQQLVRGRPEKAVRFVIIDAHRERPASAQFEQLARTFREWKKEREARYTVYSARFLSEDRAVVKVAFFLSGRETRLFEVEVRRSNSGEWKIARVRCGR